MDLFKTVLDFFKEAPLLVPAGMTLTVILTFADMIAPGLDTPRKTIIAIIAAPIILWTLFVSQGVQFNPAVWAELVILAILAAGAALGINYTQVKRLADHTQRQLLVDIAHQRTIFRTP